MRNTIVVKASGFLWVVYILQLFGDRKLEWPEPIAQKALRTEPWHQLQPFHTLSISPTIGKCFWDFSPAIGNFLKAT